MPRSGGRNSRWSQRIPNWQATKRSIAYGVSANGGGGVGCISSCLHLLVKYAEVTSRTFLCPQDKETREFKPANEGAGNRDLIELWDFGPEPTDNCSFSYHMPFGIYALKLSGEPAMAVAADRNPFQMQPMAEPKDITPFRPEHRNRERTTAGNAHQHDHEGQNVLFLDSHVRFEKVPYRGVRDGNIYTYWDGGDIRRGAAPDCRSSPTGQDQSVTCTRRRRSSKIAKLSCRQIRSNCP